MTWLVKGESLVPVNYKVIIEDYDAPFQMSQAELRSEVAEWKNTLLNMWGDLRGWWLNGALNVTCVTNTYPRAHSNTDVSIFCDYDLLYEMVKRAKPDLFLFRRTYSGVPMVGRGKWFPPIKYEYFVLADPKKVIENRRMNKDYMFCAVDANGEIVPKNRINTRIKVYSHYFDDSDALISVEDGREIPSSWLNYQKRKGRILAHQSWGRLSQPERIVFSADVRYVLPIHRALMEKLEGKRRFANQEHLVKRVEKHQQEIARIEQYLAENNDYLIARDEEILAVT